MKNEGFYRILVENAMDALIVCDEKLNLIYTSPSTERLFGYKWDELEGRNAFEFFHPDDISAHKDRLKMLLAGTEFPSIEFRLKRKNGDYLWYEIATKSIQTAQGDKRIVVVAREFTERKKVEEALKISEGRYRGITESMADTMLEANLSGRITYINHLMPGLTREQVLASTVFDFVPPNQVPIVKKALNGVFERGEVTSYESLGPGPNGESRTYDVHVSPIYAGDKVISAVFLARDITERKNAENDLRYNQKRFKQAQTVAHIGVWDWQIQSDVLVWSEETHKVLGLPLDMVPSVEKFLDRVHPDDLAFVRKSIDEALKGKPYNIDMRIIRTDGVTVWANSTGEVEYDKEGKPARFFGMFQDITERRKMQEKLREYSENLEQIVAQRTLQLNETKDYLQRMVCRLPLALIAWDKEYKVTTWNPEATQMFGFSESEFLGKDPNNLFPSKQGLRPLGTVWKQLQKGESADIECENLTKDGKTIVCSWKNTALRDNNGNMDGVLSMVRDLTDKRNLEERLKEITYSLSGVKAGESYLTSSLQHTLKTAFDLSSHGTRGLYIIRENPDSIVRDYNFKPEDMVLISLKPIKDFKTAYELQEIAILINKFLKSGGGVVVLGGLEYLISRFGFNPVFMMIQEKRFEILEAGAILLVPINLETLDNKEKGLLGSELKFLN
ncbi:MAG TPA: PAS domain S-box protein [Candidatus Bathyarchaeia archaeon]